MDDPLVRECAACHYIHDTWAPEQGPAPAVRRATHTAVSPDFCARVGFCTEHLWLWMEDYSAYYDTIQQVPDVGQP